MKCSLPLRRLLAPLYLAFAVHAAAQDPVPPDPPPLPVLRAGHVTAAAPHHDVKLHFPWTLGIDESTLGDGDLVARGPQGYAQRAGLVSVERVPVPFPAAPADASVDGAEFTPLPQPEPALVATYRFHPPGGAGDTWTADDNGGYSVRLVEEEIATEDGRFLPPAYLGAFQVRIRPGPGVAVQPDETRCAIRRSPAASTDPASGEIVHHAVVRMFFSSRDIEVDWGGVERSGRTITAEAKAVRGPILPVPAGLATEDADLMRPSFVHRYFLGSLEPGAWRFVFKVNGVEECAKDFVIPSDPPVDDEAPLAEMKARDIHFPGQQPQRMRVIYKDRSGVDLTTLGDGDLVVFSPCAFHRPSDPVPCGWRAKRARLVEIVPNTGDRSRVEAIYEIDAPPGGWTAAHNGYYPVALWDGAVCDRLGNCVDRQRLGGFAVRIAPGGPPVPAEVEIRVDASDPDRVRAKVHLDFREHWRVVDQEVRRIGNRIYLVAKAEPLAVIAIHPPPPPPQQDLTYEIGPLRDGIYGATFVMNGHRYESTRFEVKRDRPIPAEVRLTVDAGDPAHVFADVKIQFRTPHRVVQGEVERDGHRIKLPVKAEPLPLPANLVPEPPPLHLRYEIGALPPGGYLAFFEMNDFTYTAEEFKIAEPGPPIPAQVALSIDRSDPAGLAAVVKIRFATPHVIVGRDLHRLDKRFLLEATAAPAPPGTIAVNALPELVTLRYPLGDLEPGQYSAAFVMNGWKYASTTWEIAPRTFAAKVELSVAEDDAGNWIARAKILFDDPRVRIADPGKAQFRGPVITLDPVAELSNATDPTPIPVVLEYDLGDLAPGGWWLKCFINGHFEARLDFLVEPDPPIAAKVEIRVDPSNQPVHAKVTIRFEDHYRITGQSVRRFGNLFLLDATAEGPLPILAPLPPPPVDLDYLLGELDPGVYHAVFRMNGHFHDVEAFRIVDDGFAVAVDLAVDVGDEVSVKATVDFKDPYVLITDPGKPVFDGNTIRIDATAERVNFIQEPDGAPAEFKYDLGELRPGSYELSYSINGRTEARTHWRQPKHKMLISNEIKVGGSCFFP
jgi:hypothetical protein